MTNNNLVSRLCRPYRQKLMTANNDNQIKFDKLSSFKPVVVSSTSDEGKFVVEKCVQYDKYWFGLMELFLYQRFPVYFLCNQDKRGTYLGIVKVYSINKYTAVRNSDPEETCGVEITKC